MRCIPLAAFLLASPAAAEVVGAGAHGFEVRETVEINVPRAAAWTAFEHIGQWWSAEHSYSGNASNLSLTATPGGCLCEKMGTTGGVEHLRVAVALPMQRLVMTGPLGPLLYEAVAGVMDVKFAEGDGTTIVTMDYRTSGFVHANGDKLAAVVDAVLKEQLDRFGKYAAATAPR